MIHVKQPIKLSRIPVKKVGDEWSTYMGDRNAFRTDGRKYEHAIGTCYILETKWPAGVTPIAIYAYTTVKHKSHDLKIGAMGIANTECMAILDAKKKLRAKLLDSAKKMKHTITFGADGYTLIMVGPSGDRMFGRGQTLAEAQAQLDFNMEEIDRLAAEATTKHYHPDMDARCDPPEPKKKWCFSDWFRK